MLQGGVGRQKAAAGRCAQKLAHERTRARLVIGNALLLREFETSRVGRATGGGGHAAQHTAEHAAAVTAP